VARSATSPQRPSTRSETDSLGPIEAAADRYGGAVAMSFARSVTTGCRSKSCALGIVKLAAAQTNRELGLIEQRRKKRLLAAAPH
jgi:fumarate hydratase class II